jgi:hypothetical protein
LIGYLGGQGLIGHVILWRLSRVGRVSRHPEAAFKFGIPKFVACREAPR